MQAVHDEAKQHMEQAVEALKRDLATIRTGRPTPALVEQVRVPYHGTPTTLVAMAAITVEGHGLVIKPWEQATIPAIEKGILEANLNLMPANDGQVVRVPVPPPTQERRAELAKQAKHRCEEAKIAIRDARHKANGILRAGVKNHELSEDEEHRALKEIQEMTKSQEKHVDTLLDHKRHEIMSV